jgi:hypothetical protein
VKPIVGKLKTDGLRVFYPSPPGVVCIGLKAKDLEKGMLEVVEKKGAI